MAIHCYRHAYLRRRATILPSIPRFHRLSDAIRHPIGHAYSLPDSLHLNVVNVEDNYPGRHRSATRFAAVHTHVHVHVRYAVAVPSHDFRLREARRSPADALLFDFSRSQAHVQELGESRSLLPGGSSTRIRRHKHRRLPHASAVVCNEVSRIERYFGLHHGNRRVSELHRVRGSSSGRQATWAPSSGSPNARSYAVASSPSQQEHSVSHVLLPRVAPPHPKHSCSRTPATSTTSSIASVCEHVGAVVADTNHSRRAR
jgi:hypothetical protein